MTPEQIKERFETLSYLKIHPRDKEENKYLLLMGSGCMRKVWEIKDISFLRRSTSTSRR